MSVKNILQKAVALGVLVCATLGSGQTFDDNFGRGAPQPYDNFSRANGSLGSNWVGNAGNTGAIGIVSNLAQVTASPSNRSVYYYNQVVSDYQASQVTIGATVSQESIGPAVRIQSDGSYYYVAWYLGTFYLDRAYQLQNGSDTNLAGVAGSIAVGDTLYLEANGSTLTVKHNGSVILTATDNTYSSGYVGINVDNVIPTGNAISRWDGTDFGLSVSLGSNWVGNVGNTGAIGILGNLAQVIASPSNRSVYYYNQAVSSHQASQVTIGATVSQESIGPAVRIQSDGSYYYVAWYLGVFNLDRAYQLQNGSDTNLASVAGSIAVGDTLYLEANGSTLTVKHNGSVILTATDNTYSSGYVGINVDNIIPTGNAISLWDGTDFASPLGIAITPASATVPAGLIQKFVAQERYPDGTAQDVTSSVTWSSTSPSVATVNSVGQANGLVVGSTTIQASLGSLTGSAALIVQSPSLTGVLVQPALGGTVVGGTQQFSATGVYSDGSTQNLTPSVSWSSSAASIATINANGLSTGIGSGRAVITASSSGAIRGSASLNVTTAATPPSISASVSPAPNANGWNNTNVTVTFNCGAGSAAIVNCPGPQTISSQGMGQIVSGTVTDAAGNMATASVTLNIDETLPTVTVTAPSDGAAFSASPITATGTVSDATSGVSTVTCNGTPAAVSSGNFSCSVSLNPGLNLIKVRAFDVAGNVAGVNLHASLAAALSPPASLQVSPNNVNMLVGSDQSFSATDDQGRVRNDVTWSVSNATIASLAADGSGTLTGVAPGQVTLTASVQGISGQTTVSVLSGTAFPLGTVLWSAPAISGYSGSELVQALPVNGSPDLYSGEYSSAGALVRALTIGGQELWRAVGVGGPVAPDRNGGVIAGFTAPNSRNVTLVDLDSQTGTAIWSYATSVSGVTLAIGPDGKVWLNDFINSADTLIALDGDTGIPVFSYAAPAGPTETRCNGSIIGPPSIGPDGTAYAELMVQNDLYDSCGGSSYIPNIAFSLIAVPPGGSATVTPFYTVTSLQPDGSLPFPFVGSVIPDGQGETLAAWGNCCWRGYQTHVAHGLVDIILPPLNTYAPQMVLGENQTVFATDGGNIVSFNTSGALGWSWSNPDVYGQVNLIAATYDGGLVAKNTDQGADTVVRFDVNGTPTDDPGIGTFSGLDYFIAGSSFVGFPSAGPPTAYSAAPVELSVSTWYATDGNGGNAAVFNLSVANFSKLGPNQDAITNALQRIATALPLYTSCNNWLQGAGTNQGTSGLKEVSDLLSFTAFGHASVNSGTTLSYTIGAFSGSQNPDGTPVAGLPAGIAMTVNDVGAFFNQAGNHGRPFLVGDPQYKGSSPQAQATILLHEVAHQITASGFQPDFCDGCNPKAGQQNDHLVNINCKGLIEGPKIKSLTPSSGPVGTVVTIMGQNFGAPQGSSTVIFNSGIGASPASWLDTQIIVTVPPGATTGNVVVTVAGQSNSMSFTVQ